MHGTSQHSGQDRVKQIVRSVCRAVMTSFDYATQSAVTRWEWGASKIDNDRQCLNADSCEDEGNVFMAKLIEFYIPVSFRKRMTSVQGSQRGKLIEFRPPVKKSA